MIIKFIAGKLLFGWVMWPMDFLFIIVLPVSNGLHFDNEFDKKY